MRPHHSSAMHLNSGYPQPPHNQLGPRHGSMPYEGSSNGFPVASSSRYPSGSSSYYYSSSRPPPPLNAATLGNSAAPSPSAYSYRTTASVDQLPQHHSTATMPGRRGGSVGPPSYVDTDPSYHVEHLATFAVSRQFGLLNPQDGIRKLKQMEKQSAIWAQPLLLKLKPDVVSVEDENGDIVEQFPMRLIMEPYAHETHDNQDTYNNILLFIVAEDPRNRKPNSNPPEMHIFQCVRVPAQEVAQDISFYMKGQHSKVRGGRRDIGYGGSGDSPYGPMRNYYRDDASPSSNSSETIDMNVNTLNRCFDDIEQFVARIQSAALAQREIEMQRVRNRSKTRSKNDSTGILQLRAQMPQYAEFYEIYQKFKLCFNILEAVKNYIHDPNAAELYHFLFRALALILETCQRNLGKIVANEVVSPLITFDAQQLMKNCLNQREFDIYMSLGPNWRTAPEEWPESRGPLPPPYRPVFRDAFAPYGYPVEHQQPAPIHRGSSAPPSQHYQQERRQQHRSSDDIDMERVNLEKERIAFERMKLIDRERRLEDEELRLRKEEVRLQAERDMLRMEQDRRPAPQTEHFPTNMNNGNYEPPSGISPRTRAFLNDMLRRNCKIVEVTYDRLKHHEKELTVMRGEYLEVLSDEKNWWECRNSENVVGFVPHTILSVLPPVDVSELLNVNTTTAAPGDMNSRYNPPAHHDTGVQANPPTPPPPPPPVDAPGNPSMLDALRKAILDKRQKKEPETESVVLAKKRVPGGTELPYINEIFDTINGKKMVITQRRLSNKGSLITTKSSPADIRKWLTEKNLSNRTLTLFTEFDGADLFSLSREELIAHCGDSEGRRLNSLLLVQKRRSNYDSYSRLDPALKQILNLRRVRVEAENEAAAEPEEDAPMANGGGLAESKPQSLHAVEAVETATPTGTKQHTDLNAPVKPLVPPSKIPPAPTRIQIPKVEKARPTPPAAAPRSNAPAYQPARLATPPPQPPNRNSWFQAVKSYN